MNGSRGFRSIGTQLIILFMVTSLAVLSAASYFVYAYMLGMIKQQNERLLLQQFQQLDHNIHGLIADANRLSMLFLRDDELQQLLLHLYDKDELEFLNYKNILHARIRDFTDRFDFIDSIYLTAPNQGAIGGSGTTTLVQSEQVWKESFFQSASYKKSQELFPQPVIEGGIKKSFYNPYLATGTVVSLMRGIRAEYDPRTSGTLIVNIDERYLASLYAADLQERDGDMYIVNAAGEIVSGSRAEQVGTRPAFLPPADSAYGSHDEQRAGGSVQIVYYKLQDAGWYAMKEVPLQLYSSQVLTLQRVIVLVFLLCSAVMFVITYFWLRRMMRPLHVLSGKMKDLSRGELGITMNDIPNNELGTVLRRFNEMSLSIVDLIDKNNEMQEKRRELEIEALQYQINPHFLYNTLNMVRWMAQGIKADNIVQSIVALGNILRPAFASKDPTCTLGDELSYLENYVKIINWRFNNSVAFSVEAGERELSCRVPRLILQPLVENAIAAGSQEEHTIEIAIMAVVDDGCLRIVVSDSGAGLDPELLELLNRKLEAGEPYDGSAGNGIGLHNVNKRIRLYYGDRYGLRFLPRNGGAEVVVLLPAGDTA